MAFVQKPLNKLTKEELIENIRVLKAGESFPNQDKVEDVNSLLNFHIEELKDRFDYDYEAHNEAKIKSWIDDIFGWADTGANIVNKIKGGAEVNIDGDKFDITPGETEIEKGNKKMVRNVIIGVSLFLVIGISALIFMKKKNANKSK